jgi:hypothetical protein
MLEVQNNLMWLPTVTNLSSLMALRAQPRASATTSGATSRAVAGALGEEAGAA